MQRRVRVDPAEVEFHPIRAQGAGGQNINKVANAVHLRFEVRASSLPDDVKQRLLHSADQRVSADGVVVIKAQQHRSLAANRAEALQRLQAMVQAAAAVPRTRHATQPTFASRLRRLQGKAQRGKLKALRGRPDAD